MSLLCCLLLACALKPWDHFTSGADAAASGQNEVALRHFRAACDGGVIEGCQAGGALQGIDRASADALNARACEGGRAAACRLRAESVGDPWWVSACELGDGEACADLAALRPEAEAAALQIKACEGGHPPSCLIAARRALAAGDAATAKALYATRCEALPDDIACTLAQHTEDRGALARACGQRDLEACHRLCAQAPSASVCAASAEALASACSAGDGAACRARAEALNSAGQDADEVNRILWRACDDSEPVDPWACLRLAERVERGLGSLPREARGDVSWLRDQACDLQLAYACAPHAGW